MAWHGMVWHERHRGKSEKKESRENLLSEFTLKFNVQVESVTLYVCIFFTDITELQALPTMEH